MSRLVVVVVVGICVAVVACKNKEAAPAKRTPTPVEGSGSPTGSGSAATAPTPGPATTVVSSKGVGPITDLMQGARDDDAQRALLAKAVEPLGLTVEIAVIDLPGEIETEEGYFSVKKGDTEILQIFRGSEASPKMTVHIVDPMFGTADAIKVGDTAGTLAAKRKDVACAVDAKSPIGLLTCRSATDGGVTFVLDAQGFRGTRFDLAANADRKIVEIVL
jgi:hypothetical protein